MTELSVGLWLRRERERREIALQHIANQTKVAVPLLEGLEAGDLSRWPGGIYRRAFVRSYARALGLDAEEVLRRVEAEHPSAPGEPIPLMVPASPTSTPQSVASERNSQPPAVVAVAGVGRRARLLGTAADLTVALVLGLGSAAAGSRLLWPVLFIAVYYAVGVLLTGTSPMVALLSDGSVPQPAAAPERPPRAPVELAVEARAAQRPAADRRRRVTRAQRASKAARHRMQ